jgi:hypothetical protein
MGVATAMVGPGSTPLCHAACNERKEVVEALIEARAPVDPDALALSMETANLRHVPPAIMALLRRHIEAQRKGTTATGVAATIADPCGCQSLSGRPSDQRSNGIRVVRVVGHEGWSEIYCLCDRCHRRWKVEEDLGYHYPTYNWSNVTHDAACAHFYE